VVVFVLLFALSSFIGEKFRYDIQYLLIIRGTLETEVVEVRKMDEVEVIYLKYRTRLLGNFFRLDADVYCRLEDFYPVLIRTRYGRGDEAIRGEQSYYPEEKRAVFSRTKNGKTDAKEYKRKNPVQDITTVFLYLRTLDLKEGMEIPLSLREGEYIARVKGIEKISVPYMKSKVFLLESDPPALKFWISADEKRLPLKFELKKFIGNVKMSLVDYKPPD